MKRQFSKSLFLLLILSTVFGGWFALPQNVTEAATLFYNKGEVGMINGQNYVFAGTDYTVEIFELTDKGKLNKISELTGAERVNDLYLDTENGKAFAYVLTGQYVLKYDVSNPAKPKTLIKRDLYEWKRGQYRIGYMRSITGAGDYIYIAGARGVRKMPKENLFVVGVPSFEASLSVTAGNGRLAILGEKKALVYDLKTDKLISEQKIANLDLAQRKPLIDQVGNVYFPSDNSLMKINNQGVLTATYFNPVASGVLGSYGASAVSENEIYYVNGFGVTRLNANLQKTGWKFLANSKVFGKNSWANGIDYINNNGQKNLIIFDKANVLVLNQDFQVLSQYQNGKDLTIPAGLKITSSKSITSVGEALTVNLYSFWANEDVTITLGTSKAIVHVDNSGNGVTNLLVPNLPAGNAIILATGNTSNLSYQTAIKIIK